MYKRLICIILGLCLLGSLPALAADNTYSMKTSEAGIKFIQSYEGFSSTAYVDAEGYAIGYGTHIASLSTYPDGITEEQADALMRGVLSAMESKVNAMLRGFGVTLTQNRFDAIMSLTYNLGASWMTPEYRLYNMLAAGIDKYGDDEIINTFGRYCHFNSEISDVLARRRLAEAKVFLYSDYKTGGTQNYEYEVLTNDPDTDIRFYVDGGLTISKYSDVDYTDWFFKYVSPLAYTGVVDGYGDGTFRPDSAVTGGEALKMILLAAGRGAQAPTGEHWASGYLTEAKRLGIVSDGDITDLNAPVSRALLAKIAAGALGLSVSSAASPFADTDDGCVTALYNAGIIEGGGSGAGGLLYYPDATLSRSEICAVTWRIENSR